MTNTLDEILGGFFNPATYAEKEANRLTKEATKAITDALDKAKPGRRITEASLKGHGTHLETHNHGYNQAIEEYQANIKKELGI